MDTLKIVLTVWSVVGLLGTLATWIRLDRESRNDAGARRSFAASLSYAIFTGLSAQNVFPSPHVPAWWAWSIAPLGILIMTLGQGLCWWAKKSLGGGFSVCLAPRNRVLISGGPYRICRHPMALGFLMNWLGTTMVLCSPTMLLAFGVVSIVLMQRIALEEAALRLAFGDEYLRYRERVPLIAPCRDAECEAELDRAMRILERAR
ncbi:MAG: isoprenylcysteine carboxylmethyltransferase family protein [Elusimicrobia bacterium]|nr:isoprenylcysteine carboxylmethyltransferase family protein [Elusimicrobiota bacterium]